MNLHPCGDASPNFPEACKPEMFWLLQGLPPGALEMNDFLLQGLANQEEVNHYIT